MPNLEGMTAAKQLYKWFSDLISALPLLSPMGRRVPPYDEFISGPVYEIEQFADLYARVESDERIDEVYQRIVHWMHRHGHLAILAHELCFELGVATGAIEKPGEFDESTTAERNVLSRGTDRVGAELLSAGLLAELAKREDVDLSHALAKLEPDVLIEALMSVDVDVLERIAARRTANGAPEGDSDGVITSKWSRGDGAAAAERDDGVPTSADDTPTAPASPLALLEPGPTLPDLPLPAPAPAPAHPAVDEVAAYVSSAPPRRYRRRVALVAGVVATAIVAVGFAALSLLDSGSGSAPPIPALAVESEYNACEPLPAAAQPRQPRQVAAEPIGTEDFSTLIVDGDGDDEDLVITVTRSAVKKAPKARRLSKRRGVGTELRIKNHRATLVLE